MFARAGDNVVFVRGDLQPVRSKLCEGWPPRTGVYTLFEVFRGQSHVYYKSLGTLTENAVKCSVFCVLCIYYVIFVTSR